LIVAQAELNAPQALASRDACKQVGDLSQLGEINVFGVIDAIWR
jgi:hypothetical protein